MFLMGIKKSGDRGSGDNLNEVYVLYYRTLTTLILFFIQTTFSDFFQKNWLLITFLTFYNKKVKI